MLNLDSNTRLLLVRERTEELRRQYGAEQWQTGRRQLQRSGEPEWPRRRGTRMLDRLLGRTPDATPADRAVTTADPRAIASVLHLDEGVVRRLQARGYLRTFALTHAEARQRLYLAQTRHGRREGTHLHAGEPGSQGAHGRAKAS